MRRCVVATVLLACFVTLARADYVYMRYILGGKKKDGDNSGQNQGGAQTPADPKGGGGGAGGNVETEAITVVAVVEVNGKPSVIPIPGRPLKATVKHKFGTTNLYNDDLLKVQLISVPSVKQQYFTKHKGLSDANRNPDKDIDFADWCLNKGLITEAEQWLNGLANVYKADKPTGNKKYDDAMKAYPKVRDALAKRIEKEDTTSYWRQKLGFRLEQSDHYSLLYNATHATPEHKRRLEMLEQNMKAFYYWFALRGQELAMPDQKLVVAMFDQPDQFVIQRALIEDEPLSTDGFFSARDNVVVFSSQRLDGPAALFARQMQGRYQEGWDEETLLQGKAASKKAQVTADESYSMQTLALLNRALKDESERAAVTHEGTRQLLVACGLQKPNVAMPQWLQFGMGAVFETAKGPFPLAPAGVEVAYWPSFAAPSWEYARIFQAFQKDNVLPPQGQPSGTILRAVVTDRVFNTVLGPLDQQGLVRARTLGWGLSYYLAKTRIAGVVRFYKELSTMPRDMELEPREILACFARAFDCANAAGTDINPGAFEALAKDWLAFMQTVQAPGAEYKLGQDQTQPGGGPAGGPGGGPTGPANKGKGG